MAETGALTDRTPYFPWDAEKFQMYQDYGGTMILQAVWKDATRTEDLIRFMANGNVEFLGELVLGGPFPAIRAMDTFSITSEVSGGTDILSLRTGGGAGDEALRIEADGTVSSAVSKTLALKSYVADLPASPAFQFDTSETLAVGQPYLDLKATGASAMTLTNQGAVAPEYELRAWGALTLRSQDVSLARAVKIDGNDIDLFTTNGAAQERWGLLDTDAVDARRRLTIDDGAPTPLPQVLSLDCQSFELVATESASQNRWGVFDISNVGSLRRLKVDNGAPTPVAQPLRLDCSTFEIVTTDSGSQLRWGLFDISSVGNLRRLKVDNDAPTPIAQPLRIDCSTFEIVTTHSSAQARWALFDIDSASGDRQLTVDDDAPTPNAQSLKLDCKELDVIASINGSQQRWGVFDNPAGTTRRLKIDNGSIPQELELNAKELTLFVEDSSTQKQWGRVAFSSGTRILEIGSAGTGEPLRIDADSLELYDRDASLSVVTLEYAASQSRLEAPRDLTLRAYDGVNYHTTRLYADDYLVFIQGTGNAFDVRESGGSTRFKASYDGTVTITAPSAKDARIDLARTKTWRIASEDSTGKLNIVNTTDTGTPTIEITTDADLYADGFLGTKTVNGDPGSGVGNAGAIAVDTTNDRLWVRLSGSWKYVDLT